MGSEEITGRVTALLDSEKGRRADIRLDSPPTCARCQSGNGCGAGIFTPGADVRRIRVDVVSGSELAIGDTVRLTLSGTSVSGAAFTVYGFPLVGALAGGIVGQASALADGYSAVSAGIGLLLGGLLARRRVSRQRQRSGAECHLVIRGRSSA